MGAEVSLIVCRGVFGGTEDTAVALALFGNLMFDRRFARANTVIGAFMLTALILDDHKTGAETLAIEHLVARQSHDHAFVDIVVRVVYPSELRIDLVREFFRLLEFLQEIVGTHIDLLHICTSLFS